VAVVSPLAISSAPCSYVASLDDRGHVSLHKVHYEQGSAQALGLKWDNIGSEKPKSGTEIHNEALAAALKKKLDLRQEELQRLLYGVQRDLSWDCFIQVEERYCAPVAPPPTFETVWTWQPPLYQGHKEGELVDDGSLRRQGGGGGAPLHDGDCVLGLRWRPDGGECETPQIVVCTERGRVFVLDSDRQVVAIDLAVPLSSFSLGRIRGPLLGGSTGLAVVLLSGQLRLYSDLRLSHLRHPEPMQVAHPEIAHLLEEARSAAVAMGGCGEGGGGGGDHRDAVDAALYAGWENDESEIVRYRAWLMAQLRSPGGKGDVTLGPGALS